MSERVSSVIVGWFGSISRRGWKKKLSHGKQKLPRKNWDRLLSSPTFSCNVVVSFLLKNTCNCFQNQVSSVSFSRKKLIQNGHRVSIRCFLSSCAIRSHGKINNAESNAQCADSSSYSSCCFFVQKAKKDGGEEDSFFTLDS